MRWRSSSLTGAGTERPVLAAPSGGCSAAQGDRTSVRRCPGAASVTGRCALSPPWRPTSRVGAVLAALPADASLEEAVDVAVEHRGGVADLMLGAQVLDHLVRMQDIGTHLVAPAGPLALECVQCGALLRLADLQQPGLEHLQRGGAVLDLRLLVLHRHHDAGG